MAFSSFKNLELSQRLALIERFRRLVHGEKDEIARLITIETGKPLVEALVSEIFSVLETAEWLCQNAATLLRPQAVPLNKVFFAGKDSYNVYEPIGVVAVISPWNYPFSIPLTTILTALAAGNVVVLKPSPKTALVGARIADLFVRAGFPPHVVSLVQGDREQAEALIKSGIDRVMFTGSVAGGRAIASLAAGLLIPCTLELGGKHPAIVLADSDVEAIAGPLVWSAFTNAGQACASIERMFVEKPIYNELCAAVCKRAASLRIGDGLAAGTDVGPLIDEGSLARVEAQINQSVARGASLLCGGRVRKDLGGYFLEPAVIADVEPDMPVMAQEIFGPVLPIMAVSSAEQAVELANQSELGLAASVWTRNVKRGEDISRQLAAGVIWVNDGLYSHVCPEAPWGGVKASGYGRMHSSIELKDLTYVKNIGVSSQGKRDWNYPYSDSSMDLVGGGIDLLHGGGLGSRFAGVMRVLKSFAGRRDSHE